METLKTKSVIGADRRLRIDMEISLPPGPVEVVVVVSPKTGVLPADINPEAVPPALPCSSRVWGVWRSAFLATNRRNSL